jgi:hypothetical protein
MIWLCLAFAAKILLTAMTADSVLAHVLSGIFRYWLPSIVFDLIVDHALDNLHNLATLASN